MSRPVDEFVVLHVDDDPQLLGLSEEFLPREDDRLVVETASDPTAAVERIQRTDYDAVISDHQMPGLTGLELLERIRDHGHELPVIMFTGKGREAVASEALNLGADRYLQKGGDPTAQYTVLADAVVQEIEHANAKSSLQENKAKYAGVYENAPLAFVIWDTERRVVDCAAQEPINDLAIVYLNRLSDALFVFARQANRLDGVKEESPEY